MPETDDIGAQLAYYRRSQGILQKDLCKKLKFKRGVISAYENREIKLVNVKILKSIIKELKIENKIKLPVYENFIINNQVENFQKLLKREKINILQFSKIIGVDYSNVKQWVRGESIPSRNSFKKVQAHFNVEKLI